VRTRVRTHVRQHAGQPALGDARLRTRPVQARLGTVAFFMLRYAVLLRSARAVQEHQSAQGSQGMAGGIAAMSPPRCEPVQAATGWLISRSRPGAWYRQVQPVPSNLGGRRGGYAHASMPLRTTIGVAVLAFMV
jgi:hypothetical protein